MSGGQSSFGVWQCSSQGGSTWSSPPVPLKRHKPIWIPVELVQEIACWLPTALDMFAFSLTNKSIHACLQSDLLRNERMRRNGWDVINPPLGRPDPSWANARLGWPSRPDLSYSKVHKLFFNAKGSVSPFLVYPFDGKDELPEPPGAPLPELCWPDWGHELVHFAVDGYPAETASYAYWARVHIINGAKAYIWMTTAIDALRGVLFSQKGHNACRLFHPDFVETWNKALRALLGLCLSPRTRLSIPPHNARTLKLKHLLDAINPIDSIRLERFAFWTLYALLRRANARAEGSDGECLHGRTLLDLGDPEEAWGTLRDAVWRRWTKDLVRSFFSGAAIPNLLFQTSSVARRHAMCNLVQILVCITPASANCSNDTQSKAPSGGLVLPSRIPELNWKSIDQNIQRMKPEIPSLFPFYFQGSPIASLRQNMISEWEGYRIDDWPAAGSARVQPFSCTFTLQFNLRDMICWSGQDENGWELTGYVTNPGLMIMTSHPLGADDSEGRKYKGVANSFGMSGRWDYGDSETRPLSGGWWWLWPNAWSESTSTKAD